MQSLPHSLGSVRSSQTCCPGEMQQSVVVKCMGFKDRQKNLGTGMVVASHKTALVLFFKSQRFNEDWQKLSRGCCELTRRLIFCLFSFF